MNFSWGEIYEGQYKNDKRGGYGIINYTKERIKNNWNNKLLSSILYEGELKNDKLEGYGICKYKNGEKY